MEKVAKYLNLFKPQAPHWFEQAAFIRSYYEFFNDFFKPDNLAKVEWKDVQEIGKHLHCFQSMALARANALGKPNHTIEHYRKSLTYLAHGSDEPVARIRKFATDDEYKLAFFGDSAVSELAGYLFPDQFLFANARDKFAAKFLGLKIDAPDQGDLASRLEAFGKATQPVAMLYQEIVGKQTDLPLNLEVDQFFSWLYEKYSGDAEPAPTLARQYWTLSAGHGGTQWENFCENNIIAIGWHGSPDLSTFDSKESIRQMLLELDGGDGTKSNDALACWQFVHDIRKGDVIFAKQGLTKLLGCGIVEGDYEYDADLPEFRHTRKVNWLAKGEWELTGDAKMALKTLTNVTSDPEFVEIVGQLMGLDFESGEKIDLPTLNGGRTAYWWLNANPKIWSFDEFAIGQRQSYTSHNEKGNKRQKYKHFQDAKAGDIVVGYVTGPQKEVVAVCKITKGLHQTDEGEAIEFEKVEHLNKPLQYEALQAIPGLAESEPLVNNQGSLFKLTESQYDLIRNLIDDTNLAAPTEVKAYTKQFAMAGLFLSESRFDQMLAALVEKKNVVLQGAPGVGKTFVAKRLAFARIGSNDPQRIEMIQFHQSYSYEDFIQGFRPTPKGHFDLKCGVFHQFCRRAQRDEAAQKPYVFIIDEINRGNLSRIFGEVMMLIEADKRGSSFAIPLAYSQDPNERFYIPENLHFIGTMNTADRSLAMVDYALRRRFRFVTLDPEFDSLHFREHLVGMGAATGLVDKIVTRMKALNEAIASDVKNLGPGYRIGHSYFCPGDGIAPDEQWYQRVVESEIEPLIREYWFDNEQKVQEHRSALLA